MRSISRRAFLQTTLATAALSAKASTPGRGRVVILGFDGVKPEIVEEMLGNGELPNLARLRDGGAYARLGSSIPPQSPTAWSSFATCTRPGKHGIYDFLRRNPQNYMPGLGFGITRHPELAPDGSLDAPASSVNFRQGETFWRVAARHGRRCKILTVPYAYPPEDLDDGVQLCGLEVPDIRGTTSTFFSMSDGFTSSQLEARVSGGMRLPLHFEGDTATVMVPGARDPRERRATYVEVPLTVRADRENREVTLTVQDQQAVVREGGWSDWLEWEFEVTPRFSVHAISRFHVLEAGGQVRLYMTCLQMHPRRPYLPFSFPGDYAAELEDRYGKFKTIGWAYDTHALRQDGLGEDAFLEDIHRTMAWRRMLALDELDRGDFDLLIAGWTATDRVGHMFWRFRDPDHPLYTEAGANKYGRALEDTYAAMDEIVGEVADRLRTDDLLMVMSDHGFHSFRKGFNLNTWLVRNGYLAVKGASNPATAHTDQRYLLGFDWPNSKAYVLGLGSLYLNIRGREGQGAVAPEDVPALLEEIRSKLLDVTDPETGDRVFNAIYTRDEYVGDADNDAPDIQVGFAEGYQMTKASAAGSAPRELFEPNDDKWSGEHAASDVAITPGILFANAPITGQPSLVDLGVTALASLGVPAPARFEGKPFLVR